LRVLTASSMSVSLATLVIGIRTTPDRGPHITRSASGSHEAARVDERASWFAVRLKPDTTRKLSR
jgi:hypothetical protein